MLGKQFLLSPRYLTALTLLCIRMVEKAYVRQSLYKQLELGGKGCNVRTLPNGLDWALCTSIFHSKTRERNIAHLYRAKKRNRAEKVPYSFLSDFGQLELLSDATNCGELQCRSGRRNSFVHAQCVADGIGIVCGEAGLARW